MVVVGSARIRICFYETFARIGEISSASFGVSVYMSSPKVGKKNLIISATEIYRPNVILFHAGYISSIALIKRYNVQSTFYTKAKVIY